MAIRQLGKLLNNVLSGGEPSAPKLINYPTIAYAPKQLGGRI